MRAPEPAAPRPRDAAHGAYSPAVAALRPHRGLEYDACVPRPLVVSHRWLPASTGTPIVLYELFRHFPAQSVRVLCGPGLTPRSQLKLPFPTTRLTIERVDRYLSGAYRLAGKRMLPLVRQALRAAVLRERPSAIYAHYPDAVFVTAAALTAEEFGIPLTIYFDILWGGNDEPGLADEYEHRVCTIARHRFAITEMYCEYLSAKHGLPFQLMPHVITSPPPSPPVAAHERARKIHLGGNVYPNMNLDAVQTLHRVLAAEASPPELEILGFTPREDLTRWGIDGSFVKTGTVPRDQLLDIQRKSAVLYLPEAFESPVPDMIRNNFPTKALEYMLTGTPILVHAPADCYLSRSAREHGWGVLVDQPGTAPLRAGLDRVLAGGPEIDTTVQRALEFARSRDGATWSRKLMHALGMP